MTPIPQDQSIGLMPEGPGIGGERACALRHVLNNETVIPLPLAQRILAALENSQWMGAGSGPLRVLGAELRAAVERKT
jgi:hypothetical protein